jgi:hypothetical protein
MCCCVEIHNRTVVNTTSLSYRFAKVKLCIFYGVFRYTATYKRRKHVSYGYMKYKLGL